MQYKYNDNGDLIEANDGKNIWLWTYENGLVTYHKGPSTEWSKKYDEQGREVKYICGDRVVNTWYDADGVAHNDDDSLEPV